MQFNAKVSPPIKPKRKHKNEKPKEKRYCQKPFPPEFYKWNGVFKKEEINNHQINHQPDTIYCLIEKWLFF